MQPYDQEPITITTSRDFGESAHWPSETPEKGAGPMQSVCGAGNGRAEPRTCQGRNLWGEKKEKVQSISSASNGFSTARLSSPVWSVAFYFYLDPFFFLFICFLSLLTQAFLPRAGVRDPLSLFTGFSLAEMLLIRCQGATQAWTRKKHRGENAWVHIIPRTRLPVPGMDEDLECGLWAEVGGAVEEVSTSCLALTRQSHWLLLSYNCWISLGRCRFLLHRGRWTCLS